MRISFLLEREPFGQILESTLTRYWRGRYGVDFRVRWYARRPNLWAMSARGEQAWLGNIFLNAIFAPGLDRYAFDPIRCEFARSVVGWRRPFQAAYVSAAVSPLGAWSLAQVGLGICPAVPDASTQLIVAGNHKVRILDHRAKIAYSIVKDGFDPSFMAREIETRKAARSAGVPVPATIAVGADGTWFSEEYIRGTPLNRLSDREEAREATSQAARVLNAFLQANCREEDLDEYLRTLGNEIRQLVWEVRALPERAQQALVNLTEALVERALRLKGAGSGPILISLAHGDFQPANILIEGGRLWIIDWEYAKWRHLGYDALVFGLRARFPVGLAGRLSGFVARGQRALDHLPLTAPSEAWWELRDGRLLGATIFALEELQLHLWENANPMFTRFGRGLELLSREISQWVKYETAETV